jgi:hypothetical protein
LRRDGTGGVSSNKDAPVTNHQTGMDLKVLSGAISRILTCCRHWCKARQRLVLAAAIILLSVVAAGASAIFAAAPRAGATALNVGATKHRQLAAGEVAYQERRHASSVCAAGGAWWTLVGTCDIPAADGGRRLTRRLAEKQLGRPFQHFAGRSGGDDGDTTQIVEHPAGCPRVLFCGCGVSVKVFGHSVRDLWLVANWYRFPRAAPAAGNVAIFGTRHVAYIERTYSDGTALLYDPNSGGGLTRIHRRPLANAYIVRPSGA